MSIHYYRKIFSFKINKLSSTDNIFNKDISFGDIVTLSQRIFNIKR